MVPLQMLWIKHRHWQPFIENTHCPQKVQDKLLKKILARNKNTQFGQEHNFSSITSYSDFCSTIPINTYEDLRPYIEKQEEGESSALNSEHPEIYAQTSGTTGKPKYIPILPSTLAQFKKIQALFSYAKQKGIPSIYKGPMLIIASPEVEGHLNAGSPFGSMSGVLKKCLPRVLRGKYFIPAEVFAIQDYQLKYLLIAAFSLQKKNLTFMASANPSTFSRLLDVIHSHGEMLLSLFKSGDLSTLIEGEDKNRFDSVRNQLKPGSKRLDELKTLFELNRPLAFKDFWPDLEAIATWTGGSCGVLIPKLQSILPDKTKIIEMGYLSSEFIGSINIDVVKGICLPTFQDNFFEFIEIEDWDNRNPQPLTLDQVQEGKKYYVLVTTQNGLYRYFINDIVEIGPKFNQTPSLQFVQKGRGVTNLTGEKLYETQIIQALNNVQNKINRDFHFYLMLADPEQLHYTLYIECPPFDFSLQDLLEGQLSQLNIEFEAKRKSARLGPTKIVHVNEGTFEAYKQFCIENGQREGQFKLVKLQYTKDCSFDFSPYLYL